MSESRFRIKFPVTKRRATRKSNPSLQHFLENIDLPKKDKIKNKKKK